MEDVCPFGHSSPLPSEEAFSKPVLFPASHPLSGSKLATVYQFPPQEGQTVMQCPLRIRKWADSIRFEEVVRDLFGGSRIAPVHEADIGRVAAVALTEDGHAGKVYTLTGPESLSVQDKVRIIREVIGLDIRFIKSSEEEEREQMRRMGVQEDAIDYVIRWHLNPPKSAYTVLPTVEEVTGHKPYTFAEWVKMNTGYFINQ